MAARFSLTPPFRVDPAVQQSYSSAGGTPIFFDTIGNRLAAAEIRMQPRLVALMEARTPSLVNSVAAYGDSLERQPLPHMLPPLLC